MHPADRKANQNDLILGAEPFQRFNDMLTTCMKARVLMYQQQKSGGAQATAAALWHGHMRNPGNSRQRRGEAARGA